MNEKGTKGDTLEKAADGIMSCFRICGSDGYFFNFIFVILQLQ